MLKKICSVIVFFISLLPACVLGQLTPYDVQAVGQQYNANYQALPANLTSVIIDPAAANFEWQYSTMPLSGFAPAVGAYTNAATFVFQAPLLTTTYFRRKCTVGSNINYSNVVKIEVVSVQHENMNYIREHRVLVQGQSAWTSIDQLPIGEKLQTTTYLDNIGRPLQKVAKAVATPTAANDPWGDAVQFVAYDAYSRKPKSFLPYTTTADAGNFKPNAITDQAQYYNNTFNENTPYSTVTYDNSPMNRATKANAPGTVWANAAGVKGEFEPNTTLDAVAIYRIGYAETDVPTYIGMYPNGQLIKTTSIDENGKKVVEFINKSGQLLLKKVQLDDDAGAGYTGWICTYNVYDDFGQLRFQIQPEAVKWLADNNWSFTSTPTGQTVADNLCFVYVYDAKGRNIYKKHPGRSRCI